MSGIPIGTILASILSSSSLPTGWLRCDGSPIPAKYSELMTLLNSNSTPNLIGRTLIGAGDVNKASTTQSDNLNPQFNVLPQVLSNGSVLQIGNTGGESVHTLQLAGMPTHSHTINQNNGGFGYHCRSFEGSNSGNDYPFETNPSTAASNNGTDTTGGGGAHNNVQPYFVVNYIIFAG